VKTVGKKKEKAKNTVTGKSTEKKPKLGKKGLLQTHTKETISGSRMGSCQQVGGGVDLGI